MSSETRQEQRPKSTFSFVFGLFSAFFIVIATFIGSVFLSVIAEWAGIFFEFWDTPGSEHAMKTLIQEADWISSDIKSSWWNPSFMSIYLATTVDFQAASAEAYQTLKSIGMEFVFDYVQAALYITQTSLLRLGVILTSLPAFALLSTLILTDALVQRDLRKFGVARETWKVHYLSKKAIRPAFVILLTLYFSSPFAVHPSLFAFVFYSICGYFLWVSIASYQKYI